MRGEERGEPRADGGGGSGEKGVEKELIGLGWGRGEGQKNALNALFKRVIWSTHGVGAKLPGQEKKKKKKVLIGMGRQ